MQEGYEEVEETRKNVTIEIMCPHCGHKIRYEINIIKFIDTIICDECGGIS